MAEKDYKRFAKSAVRVDKFFGDDTEGRASFVTKYLDGARDKKIKETLRRYGKKDIKKAILWWQDLEPGDRKFWNPDTNSLESLVHGYYENSKASSQQIKKALGRDGKPKERIKSVYEEPIPTPEYDEDWNLAPAKKKVKPKTPPRQPTPKELAKMSVKEIASLIKETKDALWPSGGGGEEIGGLDGVGVEDSK